MEKIKYGVEITFIVGDHDYTYRVCDEYLTLVNTSEDGVGGNDAIFNALGIDEDTKCKLASKYYGYIATDGEWPEYGYGDYAAVTELIKYLYDCCNKFNHLEI